MLVYLVVPSCGYVVQYEFEVLTPAFSLCFVGDFYLLPILFVVPHFEWSLTFLAPICFKDSILPVTFEVDHSSVASFYHFSCAVLHICCYIFTFGWVPCTCPLEGEYNRFFLLNLFHSVYVAKFSKGNPPRRLPSRY